MDKSTNPDRFQNNKQLCVAVYGSLPPEHALSVLRILGPLEKADLRIVWGDQKNPASLPGDIARSDLVLIQRDFPGNLSTYQEIVALARNQGKPLVYETDDLLWALPQDHPDRRTHYYAQALYPMLRAILEADAVTVSTPALAGHIRTLNPNVWLLPNYFHDGLWPLNAPKPADHSHLPVIIGYMGGASHVPDLEMIVPVLERLLRQYGDKIRLRFWDIRPPARLGDRSNVEWLPGVAGRYADFASYFSRQESDIFLAPLRPGAFNGCKSPIKFFEYTALGVPGVYSRIAPYENVVVHGQSGFLASVMDEWHDYLVTLIEHPDLRFQIACNAQEQVRLNWRLSSHAHEWRDAYEQIITRSRDPRQPPQPVSKETLDEIFVQLQDWQSHLQSELEASQSQVRSLTGTLNRIAESRARKLGALFFPSMRIRR